MSLSPPLCLSLSLCLPLSLSLSVSPFVSVSVSVSVSLLVSLPSFVRDPTAHAHNASAPPRATAPRQLPGPHSRSCGAPTCPGIASSLHPLSTLSAHAGLLSAHTARARPRRRLAARSPGKPAARWPCGGGGGRRSGRMHARGRLWGLGVGAVFEGHQRAASGEVSRTNFLAASASSRNLRTADKGPCAKGEREQSPGRAAR